MQEIDPELRALIDGLNSLVDGAASAAALGGFGPRAVEPLREFLVEGTPATIAQPRIWAVEALAALGAKEVLLEYLGRPRHISDPVVRMAEEGVENTAARLLAAWPDERTFQFLLELCQSRKLRGAVESLAAFGRIEAVPCFDRALEDDFTRAAAEEGFRRLGASARRALVLSAVTPLPAADFETPASQRRRASALGILAEIGVQPADWEDLRGLLSEANPEMLARLAQLAAHSGDTVLRAAASERLVGALPGLPWYLREDAEGALLALAPESHEAVRRELSRRAAAPERERARDETYRRLARIEAKLSGQSPA